MASKAILLLDDGASFEGVGVGLQGESVGEVVCFTGVVGYQEVLTDPTYRGCIVVMTYPVIGSYGVNAEDNQSPHVHPCGLVFREHSPIYSNFRATGGLLDFAAEHRLIMAEGIDTRAVTVHLRRHGEQKGLLFVGDPVPAGLPERLKKAPSPFARHLVSEVTVTKPGPVQGDSGPLAVVLDLGVKQSLLDHLHLAGCRTQRVPASWSAEQILSLKPDGVVLSNGPGDPACLDGAVETVAGLLGKLPVFGVGLGHELLAMALGAGCKRMPIGHHGVNLPVNVVGQARSLITEQHHSFVVDRDTLPRDVAVTHWHLNDETVEGLACEGKRAFSVQYHPGPDEHGRPDVTITHFVKMMGAN